MSRALSGILNAIVITATGVAVWLMLRRSSVKSHAHARVHRLKNNKGMEVEISAIGAAILKISVPDKKGALADVVLGYKTAAEYLTSEPVTYFGVVVGRVTNRIANARFTLNGHEYKLLANNGPNTLHGGVLGLHKRVWTSSTRTSDEASSVTLEYSSPDGEEGFPGHLLISVTYLLPHDKNELWCEMRAVADKPTPVSLAQHSYFNLAGHACGRTILDHVVHMPSADHYTPISASLIPTGDILPVADTPFDFTTPHAIGKNIDKVPGGYDHNYVLFNQGPQARFITKNGMASLTPKLGVSVWDPRTGRTLDVLTTAPGMQLYTGNFLDGSIVGKAGMRYPKHSGFCVETQAFPNSINQPNFPSVVVQPEQPYMHKVVFRFGTK